jgi:predicted Zn-dependent protease
MVTTLQTVWDADPRYPLPGILYAEALVKCGRRADAAAVLAVLEKRFPRDDQVARVKALLGEGAVGR